MRKMELKYLKFGDSKRLAEALVEKGLYKGRSFEYCYQKVRDAKRGYISDIALIDALKELNEARRKQVESNSKDVVGQIINS